ncbi:MAG TPA: RsmB/NOP family class I SAM-dependent RNA methyltransferase, partial [bacterium]|nr:RsmB/NOP family class I SAM-dependent RNA methyltransferase [bacterium]
PPGASGDGPEAWSRRYSIPLWMIERWLGFRGPDWAEAVCRGSARIPAVFARTNRLRAEPDVLREALEKEGADPRPVAGRPGFFRLAPGFSPASSPALAAGLFQVQDPSTVAAVGLLAPVPGETFADLCSAPGGKLGAAVELMGDRGVVIAADSAAPRLDTLRENISRLGITSARVLEYDLLGAETFPGSPCDGILLDVPCSNTGVLARRLDVRWRLRPEDIPRLAARGAAMLERAASLLKPGGRLVYSTCSLEHEENRGAVEAFLASRPEWSAVAVEEGIPDADGDGYFAARLERRGG